MKNISTLLLRSIFFAACFLTVFIVICTSYFFFTKHKLEGRIYPNVYIGDVSFAYQKPEDVKNYLLKKNKHYEDVTFLVTYEDQVSTFSGKMLNIGYDATTLAKQTYLIGRTDALHSRIYQQVKAIFNLGRFTFEPNLYVNTEKAEDYLSNLEDRYNTPAENALFKYENGKVTAFKIEKNGLKINKTKAINDITSHLTSLSNTTKSPIVIKISGEIIKPEITLASSNDFGIVEEIGVGKSDYSGSIPGRVYNVIFAAEKFNGVMIPKGEEFSFNKIIGDISAATGFQQAYIIKDGKTVLGDGGGVCQISTTLFRAALNTGLPITERHAHAYRVHYYENDGKPGLDATTYNPGVDFKFKNDTSGYILIQTEVDKENNLITFHFYGKKDDRRIEMSDIKVWDQTSAPAPAYQDDPTLKKGVTKQADWAASGAKSTFHYKVTKSDGTVIQDTDFYSNYRPWQAIFLVGTAES